MRSGKGGLPLEAVTLALAGGIFLLDLMLPLGGVISILYAGLVLLGLRSPDRRFTLFVASGASILSILGSLFSPSTEALWMAVADRGLALCAIWATALVLTKHRQAEEALRQSEAHYRLLMDLSPDALFIQCDGTIVHCNVSGARLLGVADADQLLGRSVLDFVAPKSKSAMQERLDLLRGAREPVPAFEERLIRLDGSPVDVEVLVMPHVHRGRPATQVLFHDISQRKRSERHLRVQHATARVLSEAATLEQAAPQILQALCTTLGWDMGIFWQVDRQVNLLRYVDSWVSADASFITFEAACQRRTFPSGVGLPGRVWASGAPMWISNVLQDKHFERTALAHEVGLHGAVAFPVLLGEEVRGVLEFFSLDTRPPDELLLAMMATVGRQIGQFIERKHVEMELRLAQKMEAIGQLAGGIAHDFNNLLTIITGYSQLLMGRIGPQEALRGDLEEIRKAAERASDLTRQLLAFSRRQVLIPKLVDLNLIVSDMEAMLQRLIGVDIHLMTTLESELGPVKADAGQLEQVIMNLIVNARDAMPLGGRLTIETANVELTEFPSHGQVVVAPGQYVMLAVSDTGVGMDAETQIRIFEPFFTTKEPGKGTGLGLSTVYGIVKQSGGYIFVYSEPGHGTTFKIICLAPVNRSRQPHRIASRPAWRTESRPFCWLTMNRGYGPSCETCCASTAMVCWKPATASTRS